LDGVHEVSTYKLIRGVTLGEKDIEKYRFKSGEKAQELGRKGGLAKTDSKKYSALIRQSKKAHCRHCKANCPFKKANIERAKTHASIVPEARAHAIWFNMPVMDKNVLLKLSSEALAAMRSKMNTVRDFKILHDAVMDKMKTEYPEVKELKIESKNINVDLIASEELDKTIKRLMGEKVVESQ